VVSPSQKRRGTIGVGRRSVIGGSLSEDQTMDPAWLRTQNPSEIVLQKQRMLPGQAFIDFKAAI
jgi:hypothetical protein